MGTVHQLQPQHHVGDVTWRASIMLGIGDDDTIECVDESEYLNERDARSWVERRLPDAELPEWAGRRRHGAAGAFLHGQVECGYYAGHEENDWEPDPDVKSWDADLHEGGIQWRERN